MEEQYETVIGERGVGLSGGQKQRISIARALAKHSPVLVLDDSTSALDMETEHEIQKMLNGLKNTTKIIIGHRISAVRHADEILYLEDGRIADAARTRSFWQKEGCITKPVWCRMFCRRRKCRWRMQQSVRDKKEKRGEWLWLLIHTEKMNN